MGNARVQVVRKADPEPDAGCNAPTSTEEASAAGSIGDASRYTLATCAPISRATRRFSVATGEVDFRRTSKFQPASVITGTRTMAGDKQKTDYSVRVLAPVVGTPK